MPKKTKTDKNGVKPKGRKMKPVEKPKDCSGDCQYNISEDTVENNKVKEKDVFDKPNNKQSNTNKKKKSKY